MRSVAIVQSNYIPWKGYFDLINSVDEFVLLDDVQFTKRDWRNRNKIKSPSGEIWLSVPVKAKGRYLQRIYETEIDGFLWPKKHWSSIESNYKKAEYFDEVSAFIKPLYFDHDFNFLSDLNSSFIRAICSYLNIKTRIISSLDFDKKNGQTERLLDLCMRLGATTYVSGPSAKAYLNTMIFEKNNIQIEWFNYDGYRKYPQLWGEFIHGVSVLDLLFNCGPNAKNYFSRI